MPVVFCVLFDVYGLLRVVWLLYVVRISLCVVCCLLFAVSDVLCVVVGCALCVG